MAELKGQYNIIWADILYEIYIMEQLLFSIIRVKKSSRSGLNGLSM